MKRVLPFFILSFLFAAALPAQDEDLDELFDIFTDTGTDSGTAGPELSGSGDSESAGLAGGRFALHGTHDWAYRLPIDPDHFSYEGHRVMPRMENTFEASWTGESAWAVATLELDILPTAFPAAASGFVPRAGETYVSFSLGRFLFTAGYFTVAWGSADGLNPTDMVNAKDYARGLEPVKLPEFMARAVLYPTDNLSLEAVFVPYGRADLLPVDPAASIPPALVPPENVSVVDPPRDPSSSIWGVRASLFTYIIDLSASYLYDLDPYYTPRVAFTPPADLSLSLERTRIHRIGLDAKSTIGPVGLWAEGAWSITEDPDRTSDELRNPFIDWTVGGDVSLGADSAWYFNLQYTGRYIFGYDDAFFTDYPNGAPDPMRFATEPGYAERFLARSLSQNLGDQNEGFLNGLTLRAEYTVPGGRFVPSLSASYFLPLQYDEAERTRYGSLMLKPELEVKPTEALSIGIGAETVFAWKEDPATGDAVRDPQDRLGRFADQNHLYARLGYSW